MTEKEQELVREIERLNVEAKCLMRLVRMHGEHHRKEYWAWQGDGEDHLESLCNDCAVMIRAEVLRKLLLDAKTQPDHEVCGK